MQLQNNAKVYKVSELTNVIKSVLRNNVGNVWIGGPGVTIQSARAFVGRGSWTHAADAQNVGKPRC